MRTMNDHPDHVDTLHIFLDVPIENVYLYNALFLGFFSICVLCQPEARE